MEAAARRNFPLVRLLVERGRALDVQSKNEQTALMLAVGRGDYETVEFLLKANANADCKDVLGMTALQYAQILKHQRIASLFDKYFNS
jgi:ankyrin repeat protein